MPAGHARFAVWNHTVNPILRAMLRSPLHPLLSARLALITVVGRHSGRSRTFPVGYRREADKVTIVVGWPERKVWWRNLIDGGEVRLRLRGEDHRGRAEVHRDAAGGVTVEVELET